MKCGNKLCQLPAAPSQKYCSKAHAPYGNYFVDERFTKKATRKPVAADVLLPVSQNKIYSLINCIDKLIYESDRTTESLQKIKLGLVRLSNNS